LTKVSAPKPPWCPRSGRRRRAPWPRPPRSAAGPLVGHVEAAPQRGVGGREAAPRAADQPGPEQDLRHVQLREHGHRRSARARRGRSATGDRRVRSLVRAGERAPALPLGQRARCGRRPPGSARASVHWGPRGARSDSGLAAGGGRGVRPPGSAWASVGAGRGRGASTGEGKVERDWWR
jgi:hypothetical protein